VPDAPDAPLAPEAPDAPLPPVDPDGARTVSVTGTLNEAGRLAVAFVVADVD